MAEIDVCEPQIIHALEKDGWTIRNKPFMIRTDRRSMLADLRVQRTLNGRSEQIIIVEVKCFTNPKVDLPELYTAIGQYEIYRAALRKEQSAPPLYLALPDTAYNRLMNDSAFRNALEGANIKMLIVDIEKEEVVRWIP